MSQVSFRCEEIASNRRQSNYRPPPPQPAPSPLRLPHPPGVLKNSSFSRTPLQRRWRRCRRVTRLSRRFSSSEAIRGRFSFTLEGLTGYLSTYVYVDNCVCVCVCVCVRARMPSPVCCIRYLPYMRICVFVSCVDTRFFHITFCLYASLGCLRASRVCLHHHMSHRYTYISHRCTYMSHRCT